MTRGTLTCSCVRNQYFVDWFTRLSIASARKSPNMISMTGRSPVTADPNAAPARANSEMGVSKTRSGPYLSYRPVVVAKTPPATATSSPKRITRSSAESSSSSASRIAVRKAMVSVIVRSQGKGERLLEQVAKVGQEARAVRAIDHAVIAAQRDGQQIGERDAAGAILDGCAPGTADREDRNLRRIDDRGERTDTEHAEVRDGEGAVLEVLGSQGSSPGAVRQRACLLGELGQGLPVGVAHDRHEQRVVRGDCDAHVHA